MVRGVAWGLVGGALTWGAQRLGFSAGELAIFGGVLLALYVDRLERRIAHLERKAHKLGDGH